MRRSERQRCPDALGTRDSSYYFERLNVPVPQPKCQAYLATFLSAADGKAQTHKHPGAEIVYVVSGERAIGVEDIAHVLETGDAM